MKKKLLHEFRAAGVVFMRRAMATLERDEPEQAKGTRRALAHGGRLRVSATFDLKNLTETLEFSVVTPDNRAYILQTYEPAPSKSKKRRLH